MASLRKDGRTGNWIVRYRDAAGFERSRSAETTSKAAALVVKRSIETVLQKAKDGRIDSDKIRGAVEDMMSDIQVIATGADTPFVSVRAWCARWIEEGKGENADSTLDRYKAVVDRFVKWLGPRAELSIATLSVMQVREFLRYLATAQHANTAKLGRKCLHAMFETAIARNLLTRNPAATERRRGRAVKAESPRKSFTREQVTLILNYLQGPGKDDPVKREWYGMCLLALCTGRRLMEIATATEGQVDFEGNWFHGVDSKDGGKKVLAPMPPMLREYLLGLNLGDDPHRSLFPNAAVAAQSTLSGQFNRILAAVGLAVTHDHNKSREIGRAGKRVVQPYSFHSFKHTCTSIYRTQGVATAVSMSIVGHADEDVHDGYTHAEPAQKQAAAAKFGEWFNPQPAA